MRIDHQSASPRLSVIIPTLNAGPGLRDLLASLQQQTLPPMEIIVIDSMSRDGSAALAERSGAVVLKVEQREFDHGGTRNKAASVAKGDILVFMTQDAVPANDQLLAVLAGHLADPQVACVYARQLARPEAGLLERTARMYTYPDKSAVKSKADIPVYGLRTFFCSNVCSAVRRETFEQLGRFDAPVIFNEDLFFAAKCVLADYAIAYAADAVVIHSHRYTLRQQFRRFFDNGVSMRMNDWIYPYASVHRAGTGLVKFQMRELAAAGAWHLLPALLAESAAKYAGFQLGKRYRYLPNGLCRKFSMHRQIWDRIRDESRGGASIEV